MHRLGHPENSHKFVIKYDIFRNKVSVNIKTLFLVPKNVHYGECAFAEFCWIRFDGGAGTKNRPSCGGLVMQGFVVARCNSSEHRPQTSTSVIKLSEHVQVPYFTPVLLFSKLNKKKIGCFDPENIILDNKNKCFSG